MVMIKKEINFFQKLFPCKTEVCQFISLVFMGQQIWELLGK